MADLSFDRYHSLVAADERNRLDQLETRTDVSNLTVRSERHDRWITGLVVFAASTAVLFILFWLTAIIVGIALWLS